MNTKKRRRRRQKAYFNNQFEIKKKFNQMIWFYPIIKHAIVTFNTAKYMEKNVNLHRAVI